MKHKIESDLRTICSLIIKEDKSIEQWSEIESDDMFQKGNYSGGFDATEEEFCFSVYINNDEYWFQFSLEEANEIANNIKAEIVVYPPLL